MAENGKSAWNTTGSVDAAENPPVLAPGKYSPARVSGASCAITGRSREARTDIAARDAPAFRITRRSRRVVLAAARALSRGRKSRIEFLPQGGIRREWTGRTGNGREHRFHPLPSERTERVYVHLAWGRNYYVVTVPSTWELAASVSRLRFIPMSNRQLCPKRSQSAALDRTERSTRR